MPAARGTKRVASKPSATSTSTASSSSTGPKSKKKRGPITLEIPNAPTRKGRVLTCGQGDVGQLGLGEDVPETTRFKYVTALGDKIVDTRAGGMHTIALDSDGKVWTFGCNDEGALGRPTSSDTDEGTPAKVKLPLKVVSISAGDSHSAALLENGDVYAWGAFRDSHGSMGLVISGREGKSCKEPVHLEIGEQAVDIASGGDHLVVLTTSGSVYTMGCGEQGQLGRLSQRSATRDARAGFSPLLSPSKVTLRNGASKVFAGYHATFVIDALGQKMYAWGLNNYGQLGITGEKRKTALFGPTECDAFKNESWAQVACGQHHSLAMDSQGKVYAVGRCEYGRLGLGDRPGDAESLIAIPKLEDKRCVSIAAGTSNSFAVTDTGGIFSWGMGSEGQLGSGESEDCNEPILIQSNHTKGLLAKRVAAGGQHTVLLMEDPSLVQSESPIPESEPSVSKVESKTTKGKNKKIIEVSSSNTSQDVDMESEEEPLKSEKASSKPPTTDSGDRSEVSSTSQAESTKIEKVNGDETDAKMEVDETDNTEKQPEPAAVDDKKVDEKMDTQDTNQVKTDEKTDTETHEETHTQTTPVEKVDTVEKPEKEVTVNGNPEEKTDLPEKCIPALSVETPVVTA